MDINLTNWVRIYYYKITQSIAFYPAVIAIVFLALSWGMLEIDFSDFGKQIKSGLSWLSLRDASTARSIIATVAGAIISLTVFSFSMVMIVLNQAASQMSNRVLNSMIENRFQQVILGIYIGTIVYALFLLSTIRDNSNGLNVPALSIYLLLFLTVIDIFLFIYFLDYVTQTVKYETVINRVKNSTLHTMQKDRTEDNDALPHWNNLPFIEIKAQKSGYFQGVSEKQLLEIAKKNNFFITFLHKQATFILEGTVLMHLYSPNHFNDNYLKQIHSTIDFFTGQPVNRNPSYGFKQLSEVAIKALSPGINDPGTAVLSLHALFEMFAIKIQKNTRLVLMDTQNTPRIYIPDLTFDEMFKDYIYPIWNYGKNDEYVKKELIVMIEQLKALDAKRICSTTLNEFLDTVRKQNSSEQ